MNMKRVFLFDLDGTLCESRKSPPTHVVQALSQAHQFAEIGILTGSDLDFLQEQCDELFQSLPHDNKIYALACNGTKAYHVDHVPLAPVGYNLIHEESLQTRLGDDQFHGLMKHLINMQAQLVNKIHMPLTGNFITYRGSTINWCPIGRGADDTQRAKFMQLDEQHDLRTKALIKLKEHVCRNHLKLVVNIAGDTSFDIYPEGWDKTYAMRFFTEHDVYFWGDRMSPDGNDHTMHLLLGDKSFPVTGPDDTASSVRQAVKQLCVSGNSA